MGTDPASTCTKLWAKFDKNTNAIHPLICHMIDSGNVFSAIWDDVLTHPLKQQFCRLFGLGEDDTKKILKLLVSLHDMGKASIAFQSSVPELQDLQKQSGVSFPKRSYYSPQPHDLITAWSIEETFQKTGLFSKEDTAEISSMLGGHHGFFYPSTKIRSSHRAANLGDEKWAEIRRQLYQTLFDLIQPPEKTSLHGESDEKQTALILFTGLVVTADWIASDETMFPYFNQEVFSTAAYDQLSARRAKKALKKTGWNAWKPEGEQADFKEMFKLITKANPVQEAVIEIADTIQTPFLAILEAQTGQGKTEAALYLADRTMQAASLRGWYIAMPTMATSNQMFDRVAEFLKNRYPFELINLQLAHSQAQWNQKQQSISPEAIGQDFEKEEQGIAALSWFFPRKRTLLAPFGVGTVDQALMSVLKSKHFFLRLFGLSHKVIIFDEVHAYDVYMSTLFLRLLEWLKLMGCSVIVLSATLPQNMKEKMAEIFSGKHHATQSSFYPSLTIAEKSKVVSEQLTISIEQHYCLERIGYETSDIVPYLNSRLDAGGCAAVICNTVDRAQQVYQAVKEAGIVNPKQAEETLLLFHARFPYIWRRDIEQRVLDLFGKGNQRPKKSVVVATQVIEQSLDLDFDLMVSDLAPVDLLIQRAGRVHRHSRHERPEKMGKPALCICMPEECGELDFDGSTYVYDEDILLATYYLLKDRKELRLPRETRMMIERIYDPSLRGWMTPDQLSQIAEVTQKTRAKHQREMRIAFEKLIPTAEDEGILQLGRMHLEEDSPEIHQAFQALTRLMLPSITLVCLVKEKDRLFTLDRSNEILLDEQPAPKLIEILLKSTVSVTKWSVISHFRETGIQPHGWQKTASLRGCYPVVFEGGVYRIDSNRRLTLEKEYGLQFEEDE